MNVAVDAMGGDYAPGVIVRGAVEAASELGVDVTLVGHREAILRELTSKKSVGFINLHHCEEAVQMGESPLRAIRQKKDASIRVAFDLAKKGEVDAVVSAGNSGATLAAAILILGRLEGVDRPALASIFPGEKAPVVLIDVGANVDCRPAHLFQFGVMAHAFTTSTLGVANPKIGLLSIGEEQDKGNEQVRLARQLFKESKLNFVGNVEGRDIFTGDVEIIVCDGFVGNVALKLSEGMGVAMTKLLQKELMGSFMGRVSLILGNRPLRRFKQILDYEAYGGAPLLGIDGVSIICHGGSTSRAIKNAIKLAAQYVRDKGVEKMAEELRNFKTENLTV